MLSLLRRYSVLALALSALIAYAICSMAGAHEFARWIGIATTLVVVVITAASMVRDVLRGHYGLDILALVAMIATLSVGEVLASLIIVLMLSGGEALEDFASYRASRELTALLDRSPQIAHLVREGVDGDEHTVEDVSVETVEIGDTLLVRPSEIVPVNGVLVTESAVFDESSLTGESLPVAHTVGDAILSGSINGERAVTITATHLSSDSEYQKILELVRSAQDSHAPVVRLADRFAIPFTLVSLVIAATAWIISGDPVRFAQVLVLATPCPLLIAAPVAFLGGMSRSAKRGVVVKGGAVLEQLAKAKTVAFDKTGTLTKGRPELVEVRAAEGFDADEILLLAASAEQYSSHVLADGVCRAAHDRGIVLRQADNAQEEATNGVTAHFGPQRVVVGKFAYVAEQSEGAVATPLAEQQLAAYVSVDGVFAGALVLADAVRDDAPALVAWLQEAGVERVTMLSGDAAATVDSVADALGISERHPELLPGDKVTLLSGMTPKPTLMVGDGVNDAPVLAAADVGIAMGARGSTAASEAADAVILTDMISRVGEAIAISQRTLRIALQAIWIGIVLSIGLMLVATTGVIPAVAGALMQEVIDLVAILYALRTLRGPLPSFGATAEATTARPEATAPAHQPSLGA